MCKVFGYGSGSASSLPVCVSGICRFVAAATANKCKANLNLARQVGLVFFTRVYFIHTHLILDSRTFHQFDKKQSLLILV